MLARELVLGFTVAGVLSALVPQSVWSSLFLSGRGFWTNLENAVAGPVVAFISFVCSVGNVPLAASLWHGGIAFGGVVAFIFGDLVTLPMVLIYRKQYGTRLALRLVGVLWLAMSAAGLATGYLFQLLHWVPRPSHHSVVDTSSFGWNWTSALDVVAVLALAVFVVLRRSGRTAGTGAHVGTDPTCGMQVEMDQAAAVFTTGDDRWYFCSEACRDRFSDRHREVPADSPHR
jgi:uncharacterized membrane protein YraQ (UPF0718 family)/YHS domain-containing protein